MQAKLVMEYATGVLDQLGSGDARPVMSIVAAVQAWAGRQTEPIWTLWTAESKWADLAQMVRLRGTVAIL